MYSVGLDSNFFDISTLHELSWLYSNFLQKPATFILTMAPCHTPSSQVPLEALLRPNPRHMQHQDLSPQPHLLEPHPLERNNNFPVLDQLNRGLKLDQQGFLSLRPRTSRPGILRPDILRPRTRLREQNNWKQNLRRSAEVCQSPRVLPDRQPCPLGPVWWQQGPRLNPRLSMVVTRRTRLRTLNSVSID